MRATKNRFGAANEIGVFEMTGEGLKAVGNPSEVFLQERPEGASGSVVTVCMEGTRPMLVEVQALVTGTKFGTGRRMAQGFDYNRTSLLIAVFEGPSASNSPATTFSLTSRAVWKSTDRRLI